MLKYFILYLLNLYNLNVVHSITEIKFCVISELEFAKCDAFKAASIQNTSITIDYDIQCVLGKSVFDCMKNINERKADIMNLDIGLAFYAVQNYGMRGFAVESYNLETEPLRMDFKYTSNAVVVKGSITEPSQLKGASACFSGTGTAEGWAYPIAKLIDNRLMRMTHCNNEVKTINEFFTNGSCAPSSVQPDFNTLGDNGQLSCNLCASQSDSRRYCTAMDPYAGSAGTIRCLKNSVEKDGKKSVAFMRGDVIGRMVENNELDATKYELLCIDKQADGTYVAPLNNIKECNWGQPQSRMLMTKLTSEKIPLFKRFFELSMTYFGPNTSHSSNFSLFQSQTDYPISSELKLVLGQSGDLYPPQPVYDLMFSDSTKNLYFPPDASILNYFEYIDAEYKSIRETLAKCPISGVKWCVIDEEELTKCANMKLALDSRQIRPEFYCVNGGSTANCMKLISEGFADLMTLDAAEVYMGGKYLKLVPIAIEFYGDETSYYAVAIAKRANKGILISNWKYKKTCHNAAGKATGWVKPVNVALETVQMRMYDDKLVYAFSELIGRACIPGILSTNYNPYDKNPINLCELCAAGGQDRCQPDSREQYYGDAGAFRCMLENGDIAFGRHTTVHENTDGRNLVDWARSRRSDDYELLCPDGSRVDTYSWKRCNLGRIPGNMVVTASFKIKSERDAMWKMLRYAQEYFSSDSNDVFSMFASPFGRSDLMFSDTTVSLQPIHYDNQTYLKMLDRAFSREVENLEIIGAIKHSGLYNPTASASVVSGTILSTLSISLVFFYLM